MRRLFGRAAGFGLIPILSAVTTLAILPVVARVGGAQGWLGLGVGLAVGAIAATVISLGWTLHGPRLVADADARVASLQLLNSSAQRLLVSSVVLPLALVVTALIVQHPDSLGVSLAATLLGSTFGHSPAWYWVGRGAPRDQVIFEAGPRLIGNLACIPLVIATSEIIWYPVVSLLAITTSYLVFFRRVQSSLAFPRRRKRFSHLIIDISKNIRSTLTTLISIGYTSLSVPLVALIAAPSAAALFVSADRLFKICTQTIAVTSNTFQGWVSLRSASTNFRVRATVSVLAHATVGAVGFAVILVFGSGLSAILFGPELAADEGTMIGFACAFLALALNSGLGRTVLAPLGRQGWILASTVAGAIVGIPSLFILTSLWGSFGAAFSVAIAELVVTAVQCFGLLRLSRSSGR